MWPLRCLDFVARSPSLSVLPSHLAALDSAPHPAPYLPATLPPTCLAPECGHLCCDYDRAHHPALHPTLPPSVAPVVQLRRAPHPASYPALHPTLPHPAWHLSCTTTVPLTLPLTLARHPGPHPNPPSAWHLSCDYDRPHGPAWQRWADTFMAAVDDVDIVRLHEYFTLDSFKHQWECTK